MTELDVYKWITNEDTYGIETSWSKDNLIIWVQHSVLPEFMDMFGKYFEDRVNEDISVSSTDIAFNFDEILEFFGIDPENIVSKE